MASEYLSSVRNRDKILSIAQFAPVVLAAPAESSGNAKLAAGLLKLAKLAEGYRTVTRFSGMFDVAANFHMVAKQKHPIARKIAIIELMSNFLFFPFEHLALLGTYEVLPASKVPQWSGMAVFFWFYNNLIRGLVTIYQMMVDYPKLNCTDPSTASKRREDFRKKVLTLVKAVSYGIFALSVLPAKGKPQLLAKPAGPLLPLHRLVEVLAPNAIVLSNTTRGMLGMVASIADFL